MAKKFPVPSMFATYTLNKDGGPIVLSVSDNYPDEYKDLCVLHEIIEKTKHQDDHEESCADTSREELELVKEKGFVIREYAQVRVNFFESVIEFYQALPDERPDKALIPKFKKSLVFWKSLL